MCNDILEYYDNFEKIYDDRLFQCPYDKATKCSLVDGCRGCEEWARFIEKHGENHTLIAR